MHQKGFAPIFIILVAVGVFALIAAGLYAGKPQLSHKPSATARTPQTSNEPLGGTQISVAAQPQSTSATND